MDGLGHHDETAPTADELRKMSTVNIQHPSAAFGAAQTTNKTLLK